jgi:hypothetical protein
MRPAIQITPHLTPTEDRRALTTFRLLTAAALGMTALLALLPAVGHDQLWCLYVGQRMLLGIQLYGPQLLESNPPLIMWFSECLAFVANHLSIPVTVVFKLAVLSVEAMTAAIALGLLRRLDARLNRAETWAFAFAFVTVFGAMPARDFGQRDHLLAVLCLPYVLAAALDAHRLSRTPESRHPERGEGSLYLKLFIGVAAGVGLCLKPHHILVPLAIELVLMLRARTFRTLLRTELLAMAATGAAAIAAVRHFTPEYLTQIVPLLNSVYWAIGHLTLPQLLLESIQLHLLLIATVALFFLNPGVRSELPATWPISRRALAGTTSRFPR